MPDNKRTIEDIRNDYTQLCAKAGHLAYSIYALKIDLDLVNNQLKDLNIEGAMLQKSEAGAPASEGAAS
jgi:hypothetical protein